MSSAEKPLHVQVAEALGWKRTGNCWTLEIPFGKTAVDELPPYGEDTPEGWACTGPLLARFGITLELLHPGNMATTDGKPWQASRPYRSEQGYSYGSEPCEATARCVAALAAVGKLP